MKKPPVYRLFAFLILGIALTLGLVVSACAQAPKVRPAFNAGAFYPGDPKVLAKMVDDFLAKVPAEQLAEPPVALVSPHAGYEFSGQVAAYAYALLKGRKFARVVVISPCHVEAFPFSSVYDGDAFATPLGDIPVDKEFAKKLAGLSKTIKLSERGHVQVEGRGEHSLEVQLPFLQRTLGEFKLVPVVMGDQDYEVARALGVALAKLIQGGDTLIVASSDLSHFHPYDEAVQLDHKVLRAIEEWDYFNMSRNFAIRTWEACGGGPIVAAMIAAERLGAHQAKILKYANSGDVTGDKSRVVGYGAVVLLKVKSGRDAKQRAFSLSPKEKDGLLKIARKSVETAVRARTLYYPTLEGLESLQQDRGAFVTLKEHGELRGCIGYIAPMKPLYMTVRDVAGHAALRDSRFSPVTVDELGKLEYEVSVLSPLHRVADIKQIRLGQDGLVLWKGEYEGVFLPQVPTEQRWNLMTYLEQLCYKAGLPKDAWRDEDADLFSFTAIVFGDQPRPEAVTPEMPQPPARRGIPGELAPGSPTPQPPQF